MSVKTTKLKKYRKRLSSPLAILKAARQLLIDVGWCKNRMIKAVNGEIVAFCAIGALEEVSKDRDTVWDIIIPLVNKKIPSHRGFSGGLGLVAFNDKQQRKEPVIRLFNQAIKELEAND